MRTKHISILILLVLYTCMPPRGQSQSYTWQPMTPDEAVQMVQRFEGNPTLQLTVGERPVPTYPLNMSQVQRYQLVNGDRCYNFDLRRRDYFSFYDKSSWNEQTFYGQPFDTNVLAPQAMSQAAAEQIARNYIRTHFPTPERLNKLEVSSHSQRGPNPTDADFTEYYEFTFSEEVNGVIGPATCYISVDTIFGRILHFIGVNIPTLVSTTPQLNPDQAYACAFNAMGINGSPAGTPKLQVGRPDIFGHQRLAYILPYTDPAREGTHCDAVVDANTGAYITRIIYHGGGSPAKPVSAALVAWRAKLAKQPAVAKTVLTPFMGEIPAKLDMPPLIIANRPYLYVGYLCYGAKEVKLAYGDRDHIAIRSPERNLLFSLNTTAYTCNGQNRQLAAKPVVVNNRCYVPLEVAQGILPFQITYDANANQVHFDALPAAKTTTAVQPNTPPLAVKR